MVLAQYINFNYLCKISHSCEFSKEFACLEDLSFNSMIDTKLEVIGTAVNHMLLENRHLDYYSNYAQKLYKVIFFFNCYF